MRGQVTSGSNYVMARSLKVKRDSVMIITEDGDRIDIAIPEGVPEDLDLPKVGTTLEKVMVGMSKGEDMLYRFFPASGSHIVRFKQFAAKRDELPAPRTQPGGPRATKDGRKWYAEDKLVFTAILEIVAGPYKGCTIGLIMDYVFQKDKDGSTFVAGGKKTVERIMHFLELCGFDTANETIDYSSNILPDLEQILSERSDDNRFLVIMKAGWVDELSEIPAGMDPGKIDESRAKAKRVFENDDVLEEDEEAEPVRKPKAATNVRVRHQPEPDPADDDTDDDADEDEEEEEPPARKAPKSAPRRPVKDPWDQG